ncbi:MAG TPA: S41 family peptidase [Candidatus Polarisedimenticolaceae bacterium]|nr:S41 family peptidase [Candidatus Polarisedimenticolaceae bacterium]
MSRSARGTVVLTVLFLGGGCLIGGLLASHAEVEADKTATQVRTFGRILALVEDNSVGKIESKDMVENAIQGMLHTLDPHSNYLNKEAYSEMKDEQRGSFYGLGIQITKRGPDKPLTILAPIDGTPASKAGLQPGDVISKIEGQDTIDLTVQDAVRKLKGEKGTKVTITIQRPGEENTAPFDVTLFRDEIPTKSIAHAFMLQPNVGLVRISNFTSTTTSELDDAIEALKAKGMTRMILDLRQNPGGLLDQAVGVSSRFIPEGKLVVYTRGRIPGSDQDYTAKGEERTDVPLVVLVDHSSASASEIVSGCIQDHDRGLVVGATTFGKGLVQRVIPLRDGGALALTTAKYYTPSGRLIQRDYSDLDDYFLDPELEEDGQAALEHTFGNREERKTDSGRIVYGGGGITPDYMVTNDKEPLVLSRMRRENQLFDFAVKYVAGHPNLKPDFAADDAMMKSFREFLSSRKFKMEDGAFDKDKKAIETRLRSQIARVKWGVEAETKVLAEGDAQVQKALTLFEEAAKLAQAGDAGRKQKDGDAGSKATDLKASSPSS